MRDVSKVLSDAETLKLRALLAQTPDLPISDQLGQEYPKMLFHNAYIELYRLIKNHPDPLVKKEAQEKMRNVIVIVHNIEDEEEYLADGWKHDPCDIITAPVEEGGMGEVNPRIPTGREGRRADRQNKATREQELRNLRRRYAELTGRKLADDDEPAMPLAAVTEVPPPAPKPSAPTSKRDKVAAATRRATGGDLEQSASL